ncbi:hypothetical protein VSR34_30245 [Paraburkholderia sp. JHI2823]|uniref:hypothetical protein n=1 Tax=Paraburkholderia sp. JHI2823 TaxID=3112960 RepID=UPI0031825CB8
MERELAGSTRSLDLFGDALKVDSLFFQFGDDVYHIGQAAIKPPHYEGVSRAQAPLFGDKAHGSQSYHRLPFLRRRAEHLRFAAQRAANPSSDHQAKGGHIRSDDSYTVFRTLKN